MIRIEDGMCGRCAHFGGASANDKLVQIRVNGEAAEEHRESCGHPVLSTLSLTVSAASGCGGYSPA